MYKNISAYASLSARKNLRPFSINRRSLSGSLIGGIKETQEMLNFCSKKNIVCDVELISIEKINEALQRLIKADVKYRFVIDMKTLKQKS